MMMVTLSFFQPRQLATQLRISYTFPKESPSYPLVLGFLWVSLFVCFIFVFFVIIYLSIFYYSFIVFLSHISKLYCYSYIMIGWESFYV